MNLVNLQITLDYKCSCCYYMIVVRKNFLWYNQQRIVIHTDGTGPPGGGGDSSGEDGETIWDKLGELLGSGIGGILKLAEAVISGLLDALISLVDMLTGKLADVVTAVMQIFAEVPQLFSGFLGFLSAVFPFFPPEIMLLLTFGIAAVVFVGIIKAIRR